MTTLLKTNKDKYTILLYSIGIIFFILNIYTPMHSDDWFYAHITNSSQKIENLSDLFKSQYIHYFEMNGRFIPHLILQFFIGFTNKFIFSLANTFIFCLFLHLVNIITTNNEKNLFLYTTIINLFLIATFLPAFKHVFIWQTGACNYLWSATFILSFHYFLIIKKISHSIPNRVIPFYILYGIICGWTHEGLVLGLVLGYIYYFTIYKKQITKSQSYLLIGFTIGACLLILSPAGFNRAFPSTNNQSFSFLYHLKSYILAFINFHNLRIFFVLSISYLFIRRYYTKYLKDEQCKNNLNIFIIALVTTFLFVWFTKHDGNRSRFGIELYSLIIFLIIIPKYTICKTYLHYCIYFIIIALSVVFIYFSRINYKEYQYLINQIKNNNSAEIIANYTYEKDYPKFIQRFIIRGILPDNLQYYNAFNPNSFENKQLSLFFNKEKIYILPNSFFILLEKQNGLVNNFNIDTNFPFYFKNIKDTNDELKYKYLLHPPKHIPIYHRPFAHLMQRYSSQELEVNNQTTLYFNNQLYILIGRNEIIDSRTNNIVLK